MEYKRSQLIGLPITTVWDGPIARVADLIVDPQKKMVMGLLTDQGWSVFAQVIPFSAVQVWSSQGLGVAYPKDMVLAKQRPEIEVVLTQPNITGQSVFSPEADQSIGQIVDVIFNQTGRVVGYTLRCTGVTNLFWFVPAHETRLRHGRLLWFNHPTDAAAQATRQNTPTGLSQLRYGWHNLWGMKSPGEYLTRISQTLKKR